MADVVSRMTLPGTTGSSISRTQLDGIVLRTSLDVQGATMDKPFSWISAADGTAR